MDSADIRGNKLQRTSLTHIDAREPKQPRMEFLSDVFAQFVIEFCDVMKKIHDTTLYSPDSR